MRKGSGSTGSSSSPRRRQLLTLLLGLDLALLLLHLGTEAALAATGTRAGVVSADHALLGVATHLQLLAIAAAALAGSSATGAPDLRAAAAAAALALADAADVTARLAVPLAMTIGPLTVPAAKVAVAGAVVGPIVALLLLRPGGPGPFGRAVLLLTLALSLVGFVSEVAGSLLPGGAAARAILDGLEEFAEAAVASWTLAVVCERGGARKTLIIPDRDGKAALS